MRDSFLKYLRYEKRYSSHTLGAYGRDLERFEAYLQESNITAQEATRSDIRQWIFSMTGQGQSPRTINRRLATLRSYYKFLLRNEQIRKDPTAQIRALKAGKKLPQFVNETDMLRLLDHLEFGEDLEGLRDQLIMELLYGTGIRLAELYGLKTTDIQFQDRTIRVLGKRNKERMIPFSQGLLRVIEKYLSAKDQQDFLDKNDYLIVTSTGEQAYPMLIYRTVRKYMDQFTTLDKRSPHVLRHTFATHLLNKGAEINAVKDLLGHASLAATQVYTHNTFDKLKAVYDKAHPKA